GDRVAALCSNRLELIELILGCAWMGAIAVPVNTALRGDALLHVFTNSGARLLFAERQLVNCLEGLQLPDSLVTVWLLGEGDVPASLAGRWENTPPPGAPAAPNEVAPGDTMAILYTSGTTGRAKGVCCPHGQFYWWGIINSEFLDVTPESVLFTSLPLFHTNALNSLFQALVAGATYSFAPRFSASRYWATARDHGADVTYLLGAMIGILLAQPPSAADREHRLRVALAPGTPSGMVRPFERRFGLTLRNGYGSTETNHVFGVTTDVDRPGYLGRPVPEFDVSVVDANDVPVADGQAGELLVRNRYPNSMATGYFGLPDATVTAWRNLWFHTGDSVVREPDGWYRFVDRAKDVIRRRGENISSVEVETVLLRHPGVLAAAAFPVPAEFAEDEVMVAVVAKPGADLDPLDLIRHCEPQLAYFAIPRYIDVVAELPVTENGKVRKAVLRERGRTPTTWDREAAGRRPIE
ncbi:MAG: carnitine-CoA ligase, partial [Actinomycetota bacterium]|nr:carnitine-CoA ligase [Actinomycetota bacterium]